MQGGKFQFGCFAGRCGKSYKMFPLALYHTGIMRIWTSYCQRDSEVPKTQSKNLKAVKQFVRNFAQRQTGQGLLWALASHASPTWRSLNQFVWC